MSAIYLLLLGATSAIETPVPPPAATSAVGAFKPFDLTYMPRTTHSVLAVRPGEFVKHLGEQDEAVTDTVRRMLAAGFAFLDGDLKAAAPPALTDIEQIVLSAQLNLSVETEKGGRSNFGMGGISSGLVRTTKPFDWAGRVKKWFPKAEAVEHAGHSYLRVAVKFGKDTSYLALFVADDRTLAFDSDEDEVKGLLDRLEKKTTTPVPVGWNDVCRELIAFCHDTTSKGWLTAPETPTREIDKAVVTVARKATGLAVGVSAGSRTTLQVIVTARDEEDAQAVRKALKVIVADLANADEVGAAVANLFAKATVSRDSEVVRLRGEVAGDLLRRLLDPDAER